MKTCIPVALVLLLIAACGKSPEPEHKAESAAAAPENKALALPELANTEWELVVIQSMDDSTYEPTEAGQFTISFGDDDVRIKAACNRGTGSYTSESAGQLQFGPIAMTKALCGPEPIHARFESDLNHIRSYVWRSGHLFLATMADGSILEFKPLGQEQSRVSPSFDCHAASGGVEDMICDMPDLAALDQKLDGLYKKALESFPPEEIDGLKAFQRGWIKGRNDCWKSENQHHCVVAEYETRITELQISTAAFMVPSATLFDCDDGSVLTAYFYNETQRKSAVLNLHPDQAIVYAEPSASGAKYTGRNVSFWDKGGNASVTWNDKELSCTVKQA